jgi:hypothetical protein
VCTTIVSNLMEIAALALLLMGDGDIHPPGDFGRGTIKTKGDSRRGQGFLQTPPLPAID